MNTLENSGGEEGIRTLDTGFGPYNGLANRRLRPLGHLTADFPVYVTRSRNTERSARRRETRPGPEIDDRDTTRSCARLPAHVPGRGRTQHGSTPTTSRSSRPYGRCPRAAGVPSTSARHSEPSQTLRRVEYHRGTGARRISALRPVYPRRSRTGRSGTE